MFGAGGSSAGLLFKALAAGLVHLNQEIFDILDLTLHRLRLVTELPVPSFEAVQLFLQGVQLRSLPLAVSLWLRKKNVF